jgi:hypothetical protein
MSSASFWDLLNFWCKPVRTRPGTTAFTYLFARQLVLESLREREDPTVQGATDRCAFDWVEGGNTRRQSEGTPLSDDVEFRHSYRLSAIIAFADC